MLTVGVHFMVAKTLAISKKFTEFFVGDTSVSFRVFDGYAAVDIATSVETPKI